VIVVEGMVVGVVFGVLGFVCLFVFCGVYLWVGVVLGGVFLLCVFGVWLGVVVKVFDWCVVCGQ